MKGRYTRIRDAAVTNPGSERTSTPSSIDGSGGTELDLTPTLEATQLDITPPDGEEAMNGNGEECRVEGGYDTEPSDHSKRLLILKAALACQPGTDPLRPSYLASRPAAVVDVIHHKLHEIWMDNVMATRPPPASQEATDGGEGTGAGSEEACGPR